MTLLKCLFEYDEKRYCNCLNPENLPGVKKKSFVLPFKGGEIWFEHLDGMYQFTDLVLEKLKNDSRSFLLLSNPSHIGFVLDQTLVTKEIALKIANLLCDERKKFMRVCFMGTDKKIKKMITAALKEKADFAFCFINDIEQAKEWLVSE